MGEYFRRRAVLAAAVAAMLAAIGLVLVRSDASYVFDGLTSRALPVALLSVLCGVGALVLLLRDAARGARVLAVAAVAGLILSWGVAQWPYLLPETLTVQEAAAPTGTLAALVVAVVLALLLVLPGFVILYALVQHQMLPDEGVEDAGDRPLGKPAA
jgi:cytochrome d ubiquinol oxidase subunit II